MKKELQHLIEEQEREKRLTKQKDRIYPEVITPKKQVSFSKKDVVCALRRCGIPSKIIAKWLVISRRTVSNYTSKTYDKLK